MFRAKNTADDESVVKLRSNMTSLGDGFKSSCMDTVLASYESFLLDFLLISSRFSAAQLSRCAGKAFEGVCDKDCGLFGRQLSHALSYARVKSKSLTSGAKTHKSTYRIIQASGKQENAELLPKPGVHVWRGAGKSPSKKRAKTQEVASSSARAASSESMVEMTGKEDIYKMYGLDDVTVGGPAGSPVALDFDSERELNSGSKQDKPPEKKAAVEEGVNSSKITLGYLDKAQAVYKVTLLGGTSRSFKPFKGHDGFLRVKMFGKLKVLDAPNILLDIPKCKGEK